jgi:hypothetical protein
VISRDHTKREIITSEKPIGLRRTLSRESGDKYKEETSSSIKSLRKGDKKKKKMKKVVYYKTDSSSPSTSDAESTTSKRHERKSIVRCLYAILAFQSMLHYLWYP